jgi:hypothetical protein
LLNIAFVTCVENVAHSTHPRKTLNDIVVTAKGGAMGVRELISAGATALVISSAAGAAQATLLTSASGYTGPVLDLSAYGGPGTIETSGPILLPGGITYSSTNQFSGLGAGYALGTNGLDITTHMIGTNSPNAVVTLKFATPVSSFGGGFNYAPATGADPTISAYDADNDLIASYDLATLAPISTFGENDAFEFRGIDGDGALIASFKLSGSYIIIAGGLPPDAPTVLPPPPPPPPFPVPEPNTWAIMLTGLGGLGLGLRSRRREHGPASELST